MTDVWILIANEQACLMFPTREAAHEFMASIPGMVLHSEPHAARDYWEYADGQGRTGYASCEERFRGDGESGPWQQFWTSYYDGNGGSIFFTLVRAEFGKPFTSWDS